MQPIRPHGHLRPSLLTTTWPISPAPPRPSHSWPSSTTPPPTPVPQKTPSSEWNGRAELELRDRRHVDVVREADGRRERGLELLAERVRALPVGEVAGTRHGARLVVDDARRPDADRGELARCDPGRVGG